MNKIGIVTLHDFNFGSVLQCFASQQYLREKGYDVEVLNQARDYSILKRYFRKLMELLSLCFNYPRFSKSILKVFKSVRSTSLRLSIESTKLIGEFNDGYINNIYISKNKLDEIGESDEYAFFLTGSDQVWNVGRIDMYYLYFLRFAPKEKRYGWAASFGGKEIARYNKKRYSKYLKDFNLISVREPSAVEVVRNLTNKDAICLADPVVLFTGAQWREQYKRNGHKQYTGSKYILFFFLDKPSSLALQAVNRLSQKTGYTVITFGYKQDRISFHLDGGPMDFLAAIDKAEYVLTDSFHAVLFSLLFQKSFYVFNRQYEHGHSQSSRILDLLREVSMTERFDPVELIEENPNFDEAEIFFSGSRDRFDVFLNHFLQDKRGCDKDYFQLKEFVKEFKSQCCGCGACADICHAKAITMISDETGHIYPHIDSTLCTNCGACQNVCSFKSTVESHLQKKGYVAFGKDSSLIKNSASGGVFATIAKSIINRGGIVYGASLRIDKGIVKCEHIAVDTIKELYKIQGSKYVQSVTKGIFPVIKEQLQTGRLVLFGGTSCQVAALKGFLRKDYDNLLTVDLICHGVPSLNILQDYLNYQNGVYKEEIIDFKFRVRDGKNSPYRTTTITRDSNGTINHHVVGLRYSAFYRLFMERGGYRPSCYVCPFASVNKPADITIGDYYPNNREELSENFPAEELLSTVVTHTEKGQLALKRIDNLLLYHKDVSALKNTHEQLNSPSHPSPDGRALYSIYREKGFNGVNNAVFKRNIEVFLPHIIKCVTKRK